MRSSTINILLLFACLGMAEAQELPDTVAAKRSWRPTGIRVGADMLSLIRSATSDTYQGWELNADIDFYRYLFTVEAGGSALDFPDDSVSYSNDGTYFRFGADVNFLPKNRTGNIFFLGLRYGRAVFSEEMSVIVEDELWGAYARNFTNSDVTARWFEATGGIKVRVLKVVWLGYTARYKFLLKTGRTDEMLPHDVPGYGTTDGNSTWGFNYQVMLRLPLSFPARRDSGLLKK